MKKILLASTALVLSAGLAHAQAVRITGEGRMGLQYDGTTWTQENRLTLNFNVSVEADHGLTFGAFTRGRVSGRSAAATDLGGFSGSRVWVEANGLRLTFGNTDGAFRGAGASHGYLGGCGVGYEGGQQCGDSAGLLAVTQGFASTGHPTRQRARVDYTMGSTRVAMSYEVGGATEFGVRTSMDAITVALGYTNAGTGSTAISASYNGGSYSVGAMLARVNGTQNYSLSGSMAMGGGNAYAYVGRVGGNNAYGVNYGYGLGGGATLSIGAERVGSTSTASVGVAFGF
jgi:outer membrane protein OmpU